MTDLLDRDLPRANRVLYNALMVDYLHMVQANRGAHKGIARLKRKLVVPPALQEWRSVEDGNPKKSGWYWCANRAGGAWLYFWTGHGPLHESARWQDEGNEPCGDDWITHWMHTVPAPTRA